MPRIVEFRIPFPCTTNEYKKGQIYSVAKVSSEMTDPKDGAGVESIANEKCELDGYGEGMYTKKYYHFRSRLPGYVRAVCPKSATFMQEEAWNCFPYAKTIINHPSFTKFGIEIVTIHARAQRDVSGKIMYEDNIHGLTGDALKKRKVREIDIGDSSDIKKDQYKAEEDPSKFKPTVEGKGALTPGWMERESEIMIAYKLITITCTYFGISGTVEDYLEGYEYNLFKMSHRKFFCWINEWHGLGDDEIREYERRVNEEMTEKMRKATGAGPVGQAEIENAIEYRPCPPSLPSPCVHEALSLSRLVSQADFGVCVCVCLCFPGTGRSTTCPRLFPIRPIHLASPPTIDAPPPVPVHDSNSWYPAAQASVVMCDQE